MRGTDGPLDSFVNRSSRQNLLVPPVLRILSSVAWDVALPRGAGLLRRGQADSKPITDARPDA